MLTIRVYKFPILNFSCFRYDLDLPVMLDYEIWKASHMLAQTTPFDEEEEEEEKIRKSTEGWNEDENKLEEQGWVSVERLI